MQNDGVGMIFCGKQAIDSDAAQLPSMIAECMGWPVVSAISKVEISDGQFKAWKDIGGGNKAVVTGSLPAVFSCDKGMNNPRFIKLKDRKGARSKPLVTLKAADVGVDISNGVVHDSNWALPQKKSECRFIEGDTQTAVQELVRLLREEAKVL